MAESSLTQEEQARTHQLASVLHRRAPLDAAALLEKENEAVTGAVLSRLAPGFAQQVLRRLRPSRRKNLAGMLADAAEDGYSQHMKYAENTVGRMMQAPVGVFLPNTRIKDAVEKIRAISEQQLITYAYVVDAEQRLLGIAVMRELLLAGPEQTLGEIMIEQPFAFRPETPVEEAMRAVVARHYPVYPVCDEHGKLLGLVQGYRIFEEHDFNLTAQAGRMVGASKEEHYSTPWRLCFTWRHGWLQLNLMTAFLAAAVVGGFEATIAQVVALAVFLPVLAGQAGNTGVQALAVTIRGLTLGEYGFEAFRRLLAKETLLGFGNGVAVGAIAAAAMYGYAIITEATNPPMLAATVWLAMIGSCMASGFSGVAVPLLLKRFGIDPAAASGIFVTTATDIASLGLFLGIATALVL
ncbi:MAG: magnesium transporter [Nevskiales bacterium]